MNIAEYNKAWLDSVKLGDILVYAWGYDQTNIEFFLVTKHTGKSVSIVPLDVEIKATEGAYMAGTATPKMNAKGKPVVTGQARNVRCARPTGFHGSLNVWNEKPAHCSWYA